MSASPTDARDGTVRGALVLGTALSLALVLLGALHALTDERIGAARLARLDARLDEVLGTIAHDNEPARDRVPLEGDAAASEPVYRVRLDGRTVGAALHTVAPDGYSGPIELLVGVRADGHVSAVRVLEHRETPGLGDRIERRRSDWIETFRGRALHGSPSDRRDGDGEGSVDAATAAPVVDRPVRRWRVLPPGRARSTADGFDALTGATITSRAVVEAVEEALRRFETHRDAVLAP